MTVSVPVLVRDKKGSPVPIPAKDALTLTEDGTAQVISTLAPATGQPLVFGLLVDTSRGQRGASAMSAICAAIRSAREILSRRRSDASQRKLDECEILLHQIYPRLRDCELR